MGCKDLCTKYKVKKRYIYTINDVTIIGRWCSKCTCFIKWEGRHCPCCGNKFRTKPRTSKSRNKLEYKRY